MYTQAFSADSIVSAQPDCIRLHRLIAQGACVCVWSYGFLIYFIVPHGLRSTQKALMPCIGAGAINHTLSWRGAAIRHLAGDLDIEPWTPETLSSSPVWSGWERDWRGENILMRGYDICSPPHILQEALSEFMGIKKRKRVCQNVLKINSKFGLFYCIITLLLHLNPPLNYPYNQNVPSTGLL